MSYEQVKPGDPAYELVSQCKKRGVWVCDAADHNAVVGCPNPDCPKWRDRSRRTETRPT